MIPLIIGILGFLVAIAGNLVSSWIEKQFLIGNFSVGKLVIIILLALLLLISIEKLHFANFQKLRNWLVNIRDTIFSLMRNLFYLLSSFRLSLPKELRTTIIYIVPFVVGMYTASIITDGKTYGTFFELRTWRLFLIDHWILPLLFFTFLVGLLSAKYDKYIAYRKMLLYDSLPWIYHAIGFNTLEKDDVRCTIWVPTQQNSDIRNQRIIQLVDFYPRVSKLPANNTLRRNRRVDGELKIVPNESDKFTSGIVGMAAKGFYQDGKSYIIWDSLKSIDANADIRVTKMYPCNQGNQILTDRRAFLVYTMTVSDGSELLGFLYFDSRNPRTFTKKRIHMIEHYLPQIAMRLVS